MSKENARGMQDELISRQAAIDVADTSDYVGLSVDDVKKGKKEGE